MKRYFVELSARMRRLVASLLLVTCAWSVAACGGGGSKPDPKPPVPIASMPAATVLDFFPAYEHSGNATIVTLPNREVLDTYTFRPGLVRWGGGSIENSHIATCENGERWGWGDGFSSDAPTSLLRLGTTKAEWIDLQTGVVRDITSLCGGIGQQKGGQPYIPYDLPQTGKYLIRVWGSIYNADGSFARYFYWQSEYTFGTKEDNACWQGVAPSFRPVIVQLEAWWDAANGWTRGTTQNPPWIGDTPNEPGPATYTWTDSIGAGAGQLWNFSDQPSGIRGCLQLSTHD